MLMLILKGLLYISLMGKKVKENPPKHLRQQNRDHLQNGRL
jgi:hypothetical protein